MRTCRGSPLDNERIKKNYITVSGAETIPKFGTRTRWENIQAGERLAAQRICVIETRLRLATPVLLGHASDKRKASKRKVARWLVDELMATQSEQLFDFAPSKPCARPCGVGLA